MLFSSPLSLPAPCCADVLDRVDYLSCVSGGSGAGALLLANAFVSQNSNGGKEHTSPPQTPPSARPKPPGHGGGRRDAACGKMWSYADAAQPNDTARGDTALAMGCSVSSGSGSAATVDLALYQLRRQCAHRSMGSMLFVVQLLVMIIILVMVMPLMAAAGATLAAASVTDAIGDTLHSLLTQGFHPFQLAAVLVFFGPIWTGLCCFVSALATHEQDFVGVRGVALARAYAPTGLRNVTALSVAGQMAAKCSTLMAALFSMLLMMLLEERLLTQTMMDEVLLLVIWISWSAVSIRTLVAPDQRLLAREKSMMSSLQMGVAVGGLWLASRACVEHVMRGQGAMAYSSACLWLVVMVLAHDLLMAVVHLLFRRRLRSAFLCTPNKSKSNGCSACDMRLSSHAAAPAALDASEDCSFSFSLAEFDNPHGGVTGLPLTTGAACLAPNAETSTLMQPQAHLLWAHAQSIFSRASRSTFSETCENPLHMSLSNTHSLSDPWARQPLPQRRRIGDVYYGAISVSLDPDAGERGERRVPFEGDGAALCAGDGMFEPRALEKVAASVWQLRGWQPALAEAAVGYVDPTLKEVDVDGRMPYLLLTTAASGYLRTFEGYSRSHGGSAAPVVAREDSGGRQELSWPFLLSPAWCGSERTGFFKTPHSLRLSGMSRNVYFCRGSDC